MKNLLSLMSLMFLFLISCSSDSSKTSPQPNVYIAGWEDNGIKIIAKYWKNGTATNLTNGTSHSFASDIFVTNNDDVHVAGTELPGLNGAVAKYWKNGVAVSLNEGNDAAEAPAIFLK